MIMVTLKQLHTIYFIFFFLQQHYVIAYFLKRSQNWEVKFNLYVIHVETIFKRRFGKKLLIRPSLLHLGVRRILSLIGQ